MPATISGTSHSPYLLLLTRSTPQTDQEWYYWNKKKNEGAREDKHSQTRSRTTKLPLVFQHSSSELPRKMMRST